MVFNVWWSGTASWASSGCLPGRRSLVQSGIGTHAIFVCLNKWSIPAMVVEILCWTFSIYSWIFSLSKCLAVLSLPNSFWSVGGWLLRMGHMWIKCSCLFKRRPHIKLCSVRINPLPSIKVGLLCLWSGLSLQTLQFILQHLCCLSLRPGFTIIALCISRCDLTHGFNPFQLDVLNFDVFKLLLNQLLLEIFLIGFLVVLLVIRLWKCRRWWPLLKVPWQLRLQDVVGLRFGLGDPIVELASNLAAVSGLQFGWWLLASSDSHCAIHCS